MNRRDFLTRLIGGAAGAMAVAALPFDPCPVPLTSVNLGVLDGILKDMYEPAIAAQMNAPSMLYFVSQNGVFVWPKPGTEAVLISEAVPDWTLDDDQPRDAYDETLS